jgi:enolase
MKDGAVIKSVVARQIFSERGHPGVETTVTTQDNSTGMAVVTAGVSVGIYEVQFVYDGGSRWGGKGVQKAVDIVNTILGPKIIGMNATRQREIDDVLVRLDGTPNKARLGGNSIGSVSAAVLKAGALSAGIPLYQHIGGVNACTLPTPGVITVVGSLRYGGGQRAGGKPSYSYMAYGFNTFSDAVYGCYEVKTALDNAMRKKYGITSNGFMQILVPPGGVESDYQLWDMMAENIVKTGNDGKVGIQVDVAAGTYWEQSQQVFVGLFDRKNKTMDDLKAIYQKMVKDYPFVVLEDPFDEIDYDGHAWATRELGIQVVGDDLFTTNIERLKKGLEVGACNTVLLKVNQIGSISEAFDTVNLAHSKGYGVMPCSSRGEGTDIADYAVGLGCGSIRESGLDQTANRFLVIESELGNRAKFWGKAGLKSGPACISKTQADIGK